MQRLRSAAAPLVVAALLLAPLHLASRRVLAGLGADRPFDVRYVPTGGALRFLSEGPRLTIANYYWLLAVQYIGEPRAKERGWAKLFPLVDLVTDLDPRHGYAYQTGGIILASVHRLEESDQILKKGMEKGPRWWTFPFYLAFNDFFYRNDYEAAARWAEIAARTPGASPNISHLALSLKVKSGSTDDAIHFLEEMLATARDDSTRAALEEQLKLAVLQRDFARLDAAVAAYRERTGHAPHALPALVSAGLVDAIPPEPFGGRFFLGPDGAVHSSARDQRIKRPEPGGKAPQRPWAAPSFEVRP